MNDNRQLNSTNDSVESSVDKFAIALAKFVIGKRGLMIFLSLLLVVLSGIGAGSLEFSSNYRVFFSESNPELKEFESFQKIYSKSDNILFVVKPKDGNDVFSQNVLAAIEKITDLAWHIPYASRVDSISNFQHSWAEENDLIVDNLFRDGHTLNKDERRHVKNIALNEPLLKGSLIAVDGRATGINVTMLFPEKSLDELPDALSVAHRIENEIEKEFSNIDIAITGIAALNNAMSATAQSDSMTLMPMMYLFLLIVMIIILRHFFSVLGALLVIIFSTVLAMGAAGYIGIHLDPISLNATIIILTLAVADSVHILISMNNLIKDGMDKNSAIVESIRTNFLAVTVTSVTTIIGFLTLNFSDAPPFWNLGNITSLGIAGAWFFSLVFLPAFISFSHFKVKPQKDEKSNKPSTMDKLAGFVIKKYKLILFLGVFCVISLTAFIPRIELNDQWVKYFDYSIPFRGDAEFAMKHLTGLYLLEYSLKSGSKEGISKPGFLSNLEKFTSWLKEQPEVLHVLSYSDIIKKLNMNMHEDDPSWYRLPDNSQLAAQYLLLYELSLPFGLDLNDRISIDKSSTRITVTIKELSTNDVRNFIARTKTWMKDNLPVHQTAEPTGTTVMFSHISKRNIESMLIGNAVAVVAIALILILSLRSIGFGLISLIPNLVPILIIFGIWAILVGKVGMAAATVSATSLGIIVDSTVHFLTKYLRGRRQHNYDASEAITYAFNNVGWAIFANTVILACGFAVLSTSGFKINVEMGQLTTLAIIVAFFVDFLFLPALLMLGHKNKVTNTMGNDIKINDADMNQAVEKNI